MNPFNQKVGAFYRGDGCCDFYVWAPFKKKVEVVETATNKKHEMQKDARGFWSACLNATPGTRYMYALDDKLVRPDPASLSQPDGVHEVSEVVDRTFEWSDNAWRGLPLGEMIIYELHTGTFTSQHDFTGVIDKFKYLKALGVNTIELMPIAQFPGERNWGYDGVFPFAVQNSYGGVNGLKKLVNEAHNAGLAVVLDVVYNHLGPEGNYLNDYGPYFTDKYKTPWGPALNFDDAYCDAVRQYFLQNALMWLDEFHVDGLRMDAVHAIWDFSTEHFMQELKDAVTELEKTAARKKVLVAELDLNNVRYINAQDKGGYGLDGQWVDEFHHALHSIVTGERDGYYEDFGEMVHLEKAFRDTYVYNGTYSPHRKKIFGSDAGNHPYDQFVVFSQNHDQIGNRAKGDRLTATLNFEELKLVAATYLLSPYVPMIFMGEEYGEKNPFQFFISHGDEQVVESTRTGRKEEFSYFNFKEEFPDPYAADTFERSSLSWCINEDPHATLLKFYTYLINFRKTRKAMQGKERNSMYVHPANDEKVLAFERFCEDDHVLILLNFNKTESHYNNTSAAVFEKIFDSAGEDWKGNASLSETTLAANSGIILFPSSVSIFEKLS